MDLTKAIILATTLHHGQTDKGNNPYILHPLRIMLGAKTDEERIVAVLHDVIEDTECTLEQLQDAGFSTEIVEAVDALTRRDLETYADFIIRCSENDIARRVKVLDIEDNMDLSRIKEPSERDISRMKRYEKALNVLKNIVPTE